MFLHFFKIFQELFIDLLLFQYQILCSTFIPSDWLIDFKFYDSLSYIRFYNKDFNLTFLGMKNDISSMYLT